MRTWNLTSDDPGAFTLAADARCGSTDYSNDHIWDFSLRSGEPAAPSVNTTFGLRARNMRLYPRFSERDNAITDPEQYAQAPSIERFYPNYLAVKAVPFTGIEVTLEYWVPASQVIAGRILITNSRLSARDLRVEWVAALSAATDGHGMSPREFEAASVLYGQTEDLFPVLFMTGGPFTGQGSFPSLAIDIEIPAGASRSITWVMATLDDHQKSFTLARKIATLPWEKEIARLEVLNGGAIEIETGDPDWDIAFALTQNIAHGLLVGPTEYLPQRSFVFSRQPDQGCSNSGDGKDHSHLWNGQTALEADFLAGLLLPAWPEIAMGLLENFISTQKQSGHIDWKPGLAGQRAGIMATPILTHLAWRIYQATEDRQYLEATYPALLKFIQAWFNEGQDRDGDGLPEWAHLMQSGLEEHPTFSRWQVWAQGADITLSESPALCALLFNEIQTLIRMAKVLQRSEAIPSLVSLADNLSSAIEASWNDDAASYQNWDRETHLSPGRQILAVKQGPGEIYLQQTFDEPVRLLVSIQGNQATPRQINVFLHGTSSSGKNLVERITEDQFQWQLRHSSVTSQRVYASLEFIEVRNIEIDDQVQVEIVDLACQDYSLFLPIFAGTPPSDRAEALVRKTILDADRFWGSYGIPLCPATEGFETHPCINTSVIWCTLIGKGLLRYGFRKEAAELVRRLMQAVVSNLQKHNAFSHSYNVITSLGYGERNAVQGLAPLSLFLDVLGVRLISSTKVALDGHNPFPWPVTIKYRGLTILREQDKTRVTFPGGQTAVVKATDAQIVQLD